METQFLTKLVTEELIGSKYAKLHIPFAYYSKYLKKRIIIPAGFICDYESVPFIKATSKRGGVIHDYLCRKDSIPIVTKQQAATIYLEAQACRDKIVEKDRYFHFNKFFRRHFKTLVVRIVPSYFHKHKVLATLEELRGK